MAEKQESPQFIVLTPEQFAALMQSGGGAKSDEQLRKEAEINAEVMRQMHERDNRVFPGVSAYNPEGNYVKDPVTGKLVPNPHPKPTLKIPVFWVGIDEQNDNLTPTEITLFNQLIDKCSAEPFTEIDATGGAPEPCRRFTVTKSDGSAVMVTVRGTRDTTGQVLRLLINFPCRGEHRHNLPDKTQMLRQMLGELPGDEASMLAEIARLRAALSARSVA